MVAHACVGSAARSCPCLCGLEQALSQPEPVSSRVGGDRCPRSYRSLRNPPKGSAQPRAWPAPSHPLGACTVTEAQRGMDGLSKKGPSGPNMDILTTELQNGLWSLVEVSEEHTRTGLQGATGTVGTGQGPRESGSLGTALRCSPAWTVPAW